MRIIGIFSSATLILAACGDDGGSNSLSDANPQVPTIDASAIDAGSVTRFVASWTLQGGCAGGDVVELNVASDFDGRITTNRFPCLVTGSGTSDHVGSGTFGIDMRVIDTSREMLPDAGLPLPDAGTDPAPAGALVAVSDRQEDVASVDNADTPVSFAFRSNTASITTIWSFQDGEQLAQTCAEAGVVTVELVYDLFGVGAQRTTSHACGDLSDNAVDLATGVYTLTLKALDGGGTTLFPDVVVQMVLYVGNEDKDVSVVFSPIAVTL